jgi:hypothetical protein
VADYHHSCLVADYHHSCLVADYHQRRGLKKSNIRGVTTGDCNVAD